MVTWLWYGEGGGCANIDYLYKEIRVAQREVGDI